MNHDERHRYEQAYFADRADMRARAARQSHTSGTWYLAPTTDRADEWSAGYDGNSFASRDDAEAAIPALLDAGGDFQRVVWVAVQRP